MTLETGFAPGAALARHAVPTYAGEIRPFGSVGKYPALARRRTKVAEHPSRRANSVGVRPSVAALSIILADPLCLSREGR
ncbi:MAG: hypothetical protein U1E25_07380 [Methylocystis sp.]